MPRLFVFQKEHHKQERKRTHGDLVWFCNLKVFFWFQKGCRTVKKKMKSSLDEDCIPPSGFCLVFKFDLPPVFIVWGFRIPSVFL